MLKPKSWPSLKVVQFILSPVKYEKTLLILNYGNDGNFWPRFNEFFEIKTFKLFLGIFHLPPKEEIFKNLFYWYLPQNMLVIYPKTERQIKTIY